MRESHDADLMYLRELKRRMKFYERIVYAFVKSAKKFRDPEKTISRRILGGCGESDEKSELSAGGEAQRKLNF